MEFKSLMHISFYTEDMERTRDFYENKLGLKPKVITYFKAYKGSKSRAYFSQMAEKYPDKIAIIYIELAPGQFIEFFPKVEGQGPHDEWNQNVGYSHFALLVEDIFKTKEELLQAGIEIDTDISKGPSETYQMWIHDPDGNKFEIMQYTDQSVQVIGNVE